MGDWWTCNRCGHAFGEFGVDRPSGCTQCHSADLAPGLTPPSERLAQLEKDLRELRGRVSGWFNEARCANDASAAVKAMCLTFTMELDALIRKHCPDGGGEPTS